MSALIEAEKAYLLRRFREKSLQPWHITVALQTLADEDKPTLQAWLDASGIEPNGPPPEPPEPVQWGQDPDS